MLKNSISVALFSAIIICVISCKDDAVPKPASQLRLDYPVAEYVRYETNCPFTFDLNTEGIVKQNGNCNLSIDYPKMKATIYLTYKPVTNNIDSLLTDAQTLTYKHVVKADDIIEQPFRNPNDKVFGMFYQVNGNTATNTRFYVTDSTKHFIDCSVYFYTKPNFDSIMPASSYVRNDLQNLMESLRWK
ncbi:gliding motility-associated lipoprotein GldD [Flavobacterium arsenatis]|uniref:Gliding motility-associated lipoprotein GldD n=1 Tax=Flavobacterium arsenatis TaxID=1484332 RepID=A0ABU1TST7_9FLAO|nr:gliding motility lipoprotein GldD [Flavobacterium arsenatis]MDR6968932.1 gliding motility-associated lipoprotein GldD [Flavobacterium arsenatis]